MKFLTETLFHSKVCRPMLDLSGTAEAVDVAFSSDANANVNFGFGCVLGNNWAFGQWEPGYIAKFKPSIEYLELFGLVMGILIWEKNWKILECW